MNGKRFKAAMRSVLSFLGEGLMWLGAGWAGLPPEWDGRPDRRRDEHSGERQS